MRVSRWCADVGDPWSVRVYGVWESGECQSPRGVRGIEGEGSRGVGVYGFGGVRVCVNVRLQVNVNVNVGSKGYGSLESMGSRVC